MSGLFASDYRETPYWWERTPPTAASGAEPPSSVDVTIIGSGYTGLHAAIATARAGLSTVVLEKDAPGAGCSTRNGGQISTSIKPGYAALTRRYGALAARRILNDGSESLTAVARFIADEAIDCDHATVGRYHAAHTAGAYRRLVASLGTRNPGVDDDATLVSRERQHKQLGSEVYHGGVIYPHHASVDPARYHAGCVEVARRAGATLIDHCAATRIATSGNAFRVDTDKGSIATHRVIVATNGYTGGLTPWLQRRLIPIGSYIIATEPLEPALMRRVMPTMRVVSDTRRLVYYYRPSPDGTRILFGGRVSLGESDHRVSARRLFDELCRLFPDLSDTRISHSWSGTVAYTFDTLAHVGRHDGVYHAMGYCGSGVGMSGYSGRAIGRAVVADLAGNAADLFTIPFPTRPLYRGRPWFLAPSIATYRMLDRLGI